MRRWRVVVHFQKCSAKTRWVRGRCRCLRFGGRLGVGAANGSVAVKMRVLAPTSTQSEGEGQEAPKRAFLTNWPVSGCAASKGTRFSKVQESAPAAGSVEVRTSALLSTARQRARSGQVRPVIVTEPAPLASAKGAPPSGSLDARRLPPASPATQREGTQETACRSRWVGERTWRHAPAPPVGSPEAKTRPSLPTATQ